jgi:hypothetical protein
MDSYLSVNKYSVFPLGEASGKVSNIYQNTSHLIDISTFDGLYIFTISNKNIQKLAIQIG